MRKESLGAKVTRLRRQALFTQEQLAAMTKLSLRTIKRIEAGGAARFSTLLKLSLALRENLQ